MSHFGLNLPCFATDAKTVAGTAPQESHPCTPGHHHAFEVAERATEYFNRETGEILSERAADRYRNRHAWSAVGERSAWKRKGEPGEHAPHAGGARAYGKRDQYDDVLFDGQGAVGYGGERAFVCVHCEHAIGTIAAPASSKTHPKSYAARWAKQVRAFDRAVDAYDIALAASFSPIPYVEDHLTGIAKNKAHPRSYGAEFPLDGFTDAQLTRATPADKAAWQTRPLTYATPEAVAEWKDRHYAQLERSDIEHRTGLTARGGHTMRPSARPGTDGTYCCAKCYDAWAARRAATRATETPESLTPETVEAA